MLSVLLDALVGGYQVAFVAKVVSQSVQVSSRNWGASSSVQMYGSDSPINGCRSGVCRPAYLWFNGYVAPTVATAAKNGVTGLPSDYTPYLAPSTTRPVQRTSAITT
jgi:hypothetical protein